MQLSSKRYRKLLKTQKLVKLRDEMQVRFLEKHRAKLQEDKTALYAMLQNFDGTAYLAPQLITKALSSNVVSQLQVDEDLNKEKQNFLQSQYRVDILRERQKQAVDMEERKRIEFEIMEHVALGAVKVRFR